MFRSIVFTLLVLQFVTNPSTAIKAKLSTRNPNQNENDDNNNDNDNGSNKKRINYLFNQDAAGVNCQKTINQNDEETFRLFCINKPRSFKLCSVSCSNALYFEGTIGSCQPHRCSFYGHSFEKEQQQQQDEGNNNSGNQQLLSMSKIAQGKVTLVAIVPLWEAQAQYFYELLEHVKSTNDGIIPMEAMVLPLYVEDKEPVQIKPIENAQVSILKTVQGENLMSHPFINFIQSLTHVSGFETFDIYIDRPVIFAVSHDGNIVERMVAPTLDTLESAVTRYSKGYKYDTTADM